MIPTNETVIAAIEECRNLGVDAFLAKYAEGHEPKSKYIRFNGHDYPLKAVWAAAHRPPIFHRDRSLSKNKPTSAAEALGFTVVAKHPGLTPREVEDELDRQANEGKRQLREIETLSRNKKILAEAKARYGYICMACDFDFGLTYGEAGEGYIECHHVNELSEGDGEGVITRIEDLAVLCANCHRVAHRRRPCFSIEELRDMISA